MPARLVVRAEEFRGEELDALQLENKGMVRYLLNFFGYDKGVLRFLCGPKGLGKTFYTLATLNMLVKRNPTFSPLMYIYKLENRLHPIDPLTIATKATWGDRLPKYNSSYPMERINEFDALVIDDIHYIAEDVKGEVVERSLLTNLLKNALDAKEKGKRVLLISEDVLSGYAEKIQDPELDELLPRFGLQPRVFSDLETYPKYVEKIDHAAVIEIPNMGSSVLYEVAGTYGIDIDPKVVEMVARLNPRPRSLVKFAELFPDRIIDEENVKRLMWTIIKPTIRKNRTFLYKIMPTLDSGLDLYWASQIGQKLLDGSVNINSILSSKNAEDYIKQFGTLEALAPIRERIKKMSLRNRTYYGLGDLHEFSIRECAEEAISKEYAPFTSSFNDAVNILVQQVLNRCSTFQEPKFIALKIQEKAKRIYTDPTDNENLRNEIELFLRHAPAIVKRVCGAKRGRERRMRLDEEVVNFVGRMFRDAFFYALFEKSTLDILT